jgi:hypothetical protein
MTTPETQGSAPSTYNYLAFRKKTNEADLTSLIRTGGVMGIEAGITGLNQGQLN